MIDTIVVAFNLIEHYLNNKMLVLQQEPEQLPA